MEKTKHSVVKHLITVAVALLLFGSSGGVAWGQTPTQMDCKNYFGAGESRETTRGGDGNLTSDSDPALHNGTLNAIVLGGVHNIVGQTWSGDGSVYTTGSPNYDCLGVRFNGYGCGNCMGNSIDVPSRWSGCDNTFFKFYNGVAIRCGNLATSVQYGTGSNASGPATLVRIDGGMLGLGTAPFDVATLHFKDIPFTWYAYTRTQGTSHTCHYGVHQTCPYYDASYSTATNTGYVDGVIYITAGSHVHVAGNVSADGTGNSKATLDLPTSDQYSLMVDGNIQADKINSQKSGVINGLESLAPYAVLGIQNQFVKGTTNQKIITHGRGGTILIGVATNATSQQAMTITASTDNAGSSFGFSGGNYVYTGTCVPTNGTANLGNYGANDVHVTDVTLPSSLAAGGLQVFNTKENLFMNKAYPITQNGAGHLLMMANKTLNINKKQTLIASNNSNGNTNLMGGDVIFGGDADESFNGSGSGAYPEKSTYSVVAFGTGNNTPTISAPLPLGEVNTCNLGYSWCGNETNLIGTAMPTNNTPAAARFQPFATGVTYGGSCHTSFSGNGNIEYNSTGTGSTVTLSNKHNAQWQAKNDIKITPTGKSFGWSNTGRGFMQWMAGHNINLANQTTANWTASGSDAAVFWRTGSDILLGDQVTANWQASGDKSVIGWQAGHDIKSNNTLTANWLAGGANTRAFWEAGNNIDITNAAALNWTTNTNTGHLRWLAKNDILVDNPTSLAWTSTGATDSVWWEAGHDIIANNATGSTFTFTQTTTGTISRIRWQAGNDIKAKGPKTFTSNPTNGSGEMIWRAGRDILTSYHTAGDEVKFIKQTQQADLVAWQAGHDIGTDTKITFENQNAANTTNMEWFACRNITTHTSGNNFDTSDKFPVTFTNKSKGDMIWHAQNGTIRTNSRTAFINDAGSDNGDMTWYAGTDIETHFGKDGSNQNMGEGVLFQQKGKGKTAWFAANDIKTYSTVYFDWKAATDNVAPITWLAGQNIYIGGNSYTGTNDGYSLTVPAQAAAKFETRDKDNDILLKTDQGMIQTNSRVDFLRNNPGAAVTKLWAGCGTYKPTNNIDIENEFNYVETNQADEAFVHLYAENDILSNQDAANSCDTRPAPILFDLHGAATSKTRTLWEAERNINTRGCVDFNYKGVTDARALVWLARGGYIQTERPVKVVYESNDSVTFRAEDWRHDATHSTSITNNPTDRRGNIHFYDSVNIKRYNNGDGVTELKAENHIWTAMMDYWEDNTSPGNKMDIISHKGDIYLGYNDGISTSQTFSDRRYVSLINNGGIYQASPSGTGGTNCQYPKPSDVSYDKNIFTYTIPASNKKGHLWIKAGWEELTDRNAVPDYTGPANADSLRAAGGNIYFTHITVKQDKASNHPTVISIPFSGLWRCDNKDTQDSLLHRRAGGSRQRYENAGIISGVNRCVVPYPGDASHNTTASDIGLIYRGGIGDLTVDAGNRGNIIFNKGAYLNFQDPAATGNATFRTRYGDIDMRDPFNVDSMVGSLAFLAQIENLSDLSKSDFCGCAEERNNVYLQDFQYKAHGASGSVFVGADNNIKLNYGGLQNIGTRHDPFLSQDYKVCKDGKLEKDGPGYERNGGCGKSLHCDADSNENKARTLLLKFDKDSTGNAITKGGFGAVASDYIDVYKTLAYFGGRGSGMGSVPGTGTLHGENVAGYGLFMKTQANKGNWDTNVFEQTPKCPTPCDGTSCKHDYLHLVSRMTFHNNAYIEAHNQKVMLWSPVIETYGLMTLDTKTNSGNNTEITLKADSLIFHDDFVKIGNKTKLSTWSGLKNDKPIMKFGHMRETPPFRELLYDRCDEEKECIPCHYYIRGSKDPVHMLDTITIKFGDDAYLERLNTVVFDHTVLTCLTDSFDHIKGAPVLNAQVRTDTLKIRNQVDLFADKNHERDAHLELISERQMGSKDYAGIYTKHLHMEPIGACGTPYSELWTSDDLALDVITTSIFGGFGFIHSDVHVENGAHLNAGFTSLRLKGQCYEHKCGTQRMKDLRLDVGAQLHFSVGTTKGLNGEYSDAIEVEKLTTYGSVDVNIEVRPCEKMEKRCYPIIYYKSLTPNSLNNLKVKPAVVKIDGEEYPLHLNIGTDGIVYVCVGDAQPVDLTRTVTIPSVTGVTTDPVPGIWEVKSRGNFKFKATYTGKPLAVRTSRKVNGAPEMLTGKKNANGEYEYVIPHVQEDVTLTIGPDFVANELLAGTAVWSHGEMIYIRVDRADIASIYSVAGQLVRKIDLPEGDTSIPMSRGAYVITLKDGSVHKVIVK